MTHEVEAEKAVELDGVLLGRVDILTEKHLIEVKLNINNWKAALGQLMVYGLRFPNHEKWIFVCDNLNPAQGYKTDGLKRIDVIQAACMKLGVNLAFFVCDEITGLEISSKVGSRPAPKEDLTFSPFSIQATKWGNVTIRGFKY